MISAVLPTHNPDPGRLRATLRGLAAQTLPRPRWELLIVDNGPAPSPAISAALAGGVDVAARIVREPVLGLTTARLAGIREAQGDVIVFVDDDNVLAPSYLADVASRFASSATLGAAGGPVVPEWEVAPPEWTREFHSLLALRERGPAPEIARGGAGAPWPAFAPVGAGLAVKRAFAADYAAAHARDPRRLALDRSGASLASGGDNDLVFTTLHAGGDLAYFPELKVTHLIPAGRLEAVYLARLNRGIMRTWVRVLHLHGQCPWPAVARWTIPLRYARARWRHRGQPQPGREIFLAGLRGQFEGQADIADE